MRKEELNSLDFSFLYLMYYANTIEIQIVKLSSKYDKAEINCTKTYYFT